MRKWEEEKANVLDMTVFGLKDKDKILQKGVPVRTPTEIQRRSSLDSGIGLWALDLVCVGGFVLFLWSCWKYLR